MPTCQFNKIPLSIPGGHGLRQPCTLPADWRLDDMFGNLDHVYLCDLHCGQLGGRQVLDHRGFRVSRHERTQIENVQIKADRAVTAARCLIHQPMLDDVTTGDEADDLELLFHWLFDDETSHTAAFLWLALGLQDAINQGARNPIEYRTSRPAIRRGLEAAIVILRHAGSVADGVELLDLLDKSINR